MSWPNDDGTPDLRLLIEAARTGRARRFRYVGGDPFSRGRPSVQGLGGTLKEGLMEIVEGRAAIPACRGHKEPLERTRKPAAGSCEEIYAERKALLLAARDAGLSDAGAPGMNPGIIYGGQ